MCFFCFNDTATTQIYTYLHTLSLHDALPIWLVIGVGVNVTSFPRETRVPASSLHFEGCPPDVTAVDLLEAFGRHLLAWINLWLDDGFAPVRAAWLRHAQGHGGEIEVRLPRETLTGVFTDLDATGTLLLQLADGRDRKSTRLNSSH